MLERIVIKMKNVFYYNWTQGHYTSVLFYTSIQGYKIYTVKCTPKKTDKKKENHIENHVNHNVITSRA